MNSQSDQALITDSEYRPSQGAFPVWSKVFTKPSEQTFLEITEHPEAKARTAYVWIFIVGTLSGLINGLTRVVLALVGLKQAGPEFGELPGFSAGVGIGGLVGAICSAPVAGLLSVVGFAIGVAIVHAAAKFFGGQGNFEKMAYAFGAIAVPFSLISALMVPLNAVPFVAFCTLPVLLVLGLYVLFLEMTAIKAVHRFGWIEAAAALLLPGILIFLLCGFIFLGLMRVAGPSLNEFFQQLR